MLQDKEPDKAKRLGGFLGETALGMAASRPFGVLGSMAAGALGRKIGGGIGQTAAYVATGKGPHALPPPPSPQLEFPANYE